MPLAREINLLLRLARNGDSPESAARGDGGGGTARCRRCTLGGAMVGTWQGLVCSRGSYPRRGVRQIFGRVMEWDGLGPQRERWARPTYAQEPDCEVGENIAGTPMRSTLVPCISRAQASDWLWRKPSFIGHAQANLPHRPSQCHVPPPRPYRKRIQNLQPPRKPPPEPLCAVGGRVSPPRFQEQESPAQLFIFLSVPTRYPTTKEARCGAYSV